MKPTLQEKYDFLCTMLEVTDIDWYEQDALIRAKDSAKYFQFPISRLYGSPDITVDEAVQYAMEAV